MLKYSFCSSVTRRFKIPYYQTITVVSLATSSSRVEESKKNYWFPFSFWWSSGTSF
jgi:hypothetical protein